jgi:ATP adenylyltransferase/5',5'''-P-1,P-4-tetraphosphate phosphorylase II
MVAAKLSHSLLQVLVMPIVSNQNKVAALHFSRAGKVARPLLYPAVGRMA